MKATIQERGNGIVCAGRYAPGDDGNLYYVDSVYGPIHTGGPGAGNYIYADVSLADWNDCEEYDIADVKVVIGQDEEES